MDKYLKLKEILNNSKHVVVFSGAGISTPSGIPDFRSANGLYSQKYGQLRPETIISHSFFMENPKDFYSFYKDKMLYLDAKPNKAHYFFTMLEKKTRVSVVTQNIDGLHSLAGSTEVYEIHGSVFRNYCQKCHKFFTAEYIKNSKDAPICDTCGGLIKPDVVLYEEQLDYDVVENAKRVISMCDTMIIIGTSLTVYPAAYYISYFCGKNLIIINKDKTDADRYATLVFNEDIINVIKNIE